MPSAPLCPGRRTQYQENAFPPLRPLNIPRVTVHVHHDLDILKYHRHFPLSQRPLNFYTALKIFLLQKNEAFNRKKVRPRCPIMRGSSLFADKAASLEMCKLDRNLWLDGRQFIGLRGDQNQFSGDLHLPLSPTPSFPLLKLYVVR